MALRRKELISKDQIALALEYAHRDFHQNFEIAKDPISFPSSYTDKLDKEASAFISSCLSYGHAKMINRYLKILHETLGASPYEFIKSNLPLPNLDSFKYRFTKGADISVVLLWLRHIYQNDGSIESFFVAQSSRETAFSQKIINFVYALRQLRIAPQQTAWYQKNPKGIHYLVPSPKDGSTCKRLNMFFRWVVRKADGIDLGLWNKVHSSDLILPLDTHLLKVVADLNWSKTKTANWKMAMNVTEELKKYCPHDPLRYDFSLCHMGMNGKSIRDYIRLRS